MPHQQVRGRRIDDAVGGADHERAQQQGGEIACSRQHASERGQQHGDLAGSTRAEPRHRCPRGERAEHRREIEQADLEADPARRDAERIRDLRRDRRHHQHRHGADGLDGRGFRQQADEVGARLLRHRLPLPACNFAKIDRAQENRDGIMEPKTRVLRFRLTPARTGDSLSRAGRGSRREGPLQ